MKKGQLRQLVLSLGGGIVVFLVLALALRWNFLFSAALALAMLPASPFAAPGAQPDADAPLAAQAGDTATMYRLYNPNSGEHFYTASTVERDAVIAAGWNDEGIGWTAPTQGIRVYRLYNSYAGEHHYTSSEVERDAPVSYTHLTLPTIA